jgi:response regulator RpfG family c-di-GMP phosphodiesterase
MNEKILCVDDEPNILEAYQRSLRKEFQIETASGGAPALEAIATRGPFAVVVSDMRMPGMDGVQFLARVKEKSPESVRIMLTGNADQQTAMSAVNEGHIFRFLTKPCPPEVLARSVSAGIQQYRLVVAEKELLEKTLSGSVQILIEILSLVNPTAFSRASRVRRLVEQLAIQLQVEDTWQMGLAAMLSQVGCVTIPEETLEKAHRGQGLSSDETRMIQNHPRIGHDLIVRIPRLATVAEIIAYQDKFYDGSGLPRDGRSGSGIPLGARVLKLSLDFDKLATQGMSETEGIEEIERRRGWYDPGVVEALRLVIRNEIRSEVRSVSVEDLALSAVLAEDVVSAKGLLLVAKGQEVTAHLKERLRNFAFQGVIQQPIKILIPIKSI